MKIIAVTYHYSTDADEINRVRPVHREFLGTLYVQQVLRASGPATLNATASDASQAPGALLILSAESAQDALKVLDKDPFWEAGLIKHREAMEWNPIFGPWSTVS